MSILANVEFFVKTERVDEFLGLMKEALVDTRAYDGCEGLESFVNQDEPGHVLLVEKWTDRSKHEAYLGWRTEGGMMDLLADFVTAAPKFSYFDALPDI